MTFVGTKAKAAFPNHDGLCVALMQVKLLHACVLNRVLLEADNVAYLSKKRDLVA